MSATPLAQGTSTTVTVTSGQYVEVNNDATSRARVEHSTQGILASNHAGRRRYGPFNAGTVTIAAIVGGLTFDSGAETNTTNPSPTDVLVTGPFILSGAAAGQDTGWLPLIGGGFRLAYALDSGTTNTTFSVDISADGVTSLGQAFTGTWASSTLYEDTGERLISTVTARFFRFNVLTGGPLSVMRLA